MDDLNKLVLTCRNHDFLSRVRDIYRRDPEAAAQWVLQFDPNLLRQQQGVHLPVEYANATDIWGGKYRVNINDHIGWHMFLRGYFDPIPTELAKILAFSGYSGSYLDVGANIGTTSIPLAVSGVEVLAVEASSSTAAELMTNIALNPSVKITVVNAAVGETAGTGSSKFTRIFRSEGNFAAGSLIENWNVSAGGRFEEYTRLITLDDLCASLHVNEILCMKLDIEGFEHSALMGFEKTMQRIRPPVIFEWRTDHLLKSVGAIADIRSAFPEGYLFYSVHHVAMDDSRGDGRKKFGIHIRSTDLSHPIENVLAIDKDQFFRSKTIQQMTTCAVSAS